MSIHLNRPSSELSSYHDADVEERSSNLPSDTDARSKRRKVSLFVARAKNKIKELPEVVVSHVEGEPSGKDSNDGNLSDDPAFNPSLVLDGNPPELKGQSEDRETTLKQVGHAIIHPRRAAREKATRMTATKISSSQKPYLTPEQDLDLLRADEELSRAASSASSMSDVQGTIEEHNEEAARLRLQNIKDNRASLKTAWAIGRHVVRVRAVRVPSQSRRPLRKDYIISTQQNQKRVEWEKWMAHLMLWYTRNFTIQYIDDFGDQPPFDVHEIARIMERFALVSAPWQIFLLEVRSIYLWENKRRTARWCALFWFLWYTEHLVGFVFAKIIYMTVRNRLYPTSVASVRKTMARGLDRQKKAQAWGELIEKHGKSDWVEPLIADMAPLIQMQLGDLTNFIEVMVNFYRWKRPSKTLGTLFYYSCCLLITLVADIRFCVKLVWFIVGGGFFFCWPIATRFPQYRVLADPVRWVFWDIPTHAELGIVELQEKAVLKDAKDLADATTINYPENDVSDSDYFSAEEELPLSRFKTEITVKAYTNKRSGHLTLSRHSLSFAIKRQPVISFDLSSILEMRKIPVEAKAERLLSFQSESEGLEFDYRFGAGSQVESIAITLRRSDQHRIFNHVLAWSGLKWQSLHLKRHPDSEEGRKEIDKAVSSIVHGK